jgi:hypothetical protein
LLHGQIAGLFAIEDAADILAGQAKRILGIYPVAGQGPDLDGFGIPPERYGDPVVGRQRNNLLTLR